MRNKIFEKIPVTIPNRSGFDLSHENAGTGKVGLLIPVMTREMEGHDSLSVNLGQQIQFPPFATDFYGRIKVYFEAFFVPYRIIDGQYKYLYQFNANGAGTDPSVATGDQMNPYFEGLKVVHASHHEDWSEGTADPSVDTVGRGSLLDYLGLKSDFAEREGSTNSLYLNNFHRLTAYHRIYEEYYLDSRIQKRCFSQWRADQMDNRRMLYCTPWRGTPVNDGNKYWLEDARLLDGTYMTGFHSRPYAKDYFTTATPDPQFGNEMSVQADANGNISISQIRAANALQQFMEIYNKAGNHYDDLAFALTGIRPSDAAVDIPIYLGRKVFDVYNKSVFVTNETSEGGFYFDTAFGNVFQSPANKYANGQSLGSGHLCDFTATEGGIFMVLMSVAPDAIYSSGNARQWDYDTIFDLPKPQLAGIGDQPIYKGELINTSSARTGQSATQIVPIDHDEIFGYTQRFAEAKFMLDEVHGDLREDGSLQAFALKRHFDSSSDVALGSEFLAVPTTALNEVSAVLGTTSEGATGLVSPFYWFDLFFEVKLVSNLPAYSVPTLENMKGRIEMIDNGGRRL